MPSQTRTSSQVSRYRILGLVGQGQFGQVFCAMHRQTGKLFALKNLEHERFPTHQFLRELRFLLSLQHPNIVTCHTIEHTQTGRYLVMDYCEGGTLRGLMKEDVELPLAQCIQLVADILCGLASAHRQGIVHCDVKPENILLTLQTKGWMAKISDFGIARLNQEVYSQSQGNTGSPAYMAPERFYGQYSAASDVYAVGVLLFELLVGRRPFSGTPKALLEAHLNQAVICPDEIPIGLQGVIKTALQKLPARRFQSAMEMLEVMLSVMASMDGILDTAMSIQTPLLKLRETIPYYDILPQLKERTKYSVSELNGGASMMLLSRTLQHQHAHQQQEHQGLGTTSQELLSSDFYPSHISYSGSTHFACRAIAPHPQHQKNPNDSDQESHHMQWRSLQLPEPIQQVLPTPQGYLLATRNILYWVNANPLNSAAPHASLPSFPKSSPNAGDSSPSPEALVAQAMYKVGQDYIAVIEPGGHWIAVVTDFRRLPMKKGGFSTLRFRPFPRRSGSLALPKSAIRLRVAGLAKTLLTAIALDKRHIAIVSDGPPLKSQQTIAKDDAQDVVQDATQESAKQPSVIANPRPHVPDPMKRTTYIEVFTRRGQRIALQYLPMCLGTVIATPKPYCLLATDRYDPTSLLCITLKPFRVKRFALDIQPKFLAATDWGYIAADNQGNIILLDSGGDVVSGLQGPTHITAMTFLSPKWLFLATWKDGSGEIYTLDLKQQMTHWVF